MSPGDTLSLVTNSIAPVIGRGFPGSSDSKESSCSAEDLGLIPGLGRSPGEGNGNPIFLSGGSHGQRNLVGYNPCGCKELDTAERLILSPSL